jgi:hypothetical protein
MIIRAEGLFRGTEFIGPILRLLDVPVIAERRARHVTRAKCLLIADIVAKVFLGGERKFLEPLMRFTRGEVRDHIVSSKIDHAPP